MLSQYFRSAFYIAPYKCTTAYFTLYYNCTTTYLYSLTLKYGKTIHEGRNVNAYGKCWKQDALAMELGDDWNQKKISLLEQKETIDDALLQQFAKVLKVPAGRLRILMMKALEILFQIRLQVRILLPLMP